MTDSTDIGLRDEGGLVGPAGSATAVTIAGFGANLLGYLVLLLAVHVLASSSYGQLVVLLNVLLVGTVPSFAVQTVTARRVATGDTAGMKQATLAVALTASVLLAVLSPALTAFLHLSSDIDLLLVAASLPAVTAMGMFQGVLQGQRRFAALSMVLTAAALGRSACGLLGLLIARDATGAVLAILVGIISSAVDWPWPAQLIAFALFALAAIPIWRRIARRVEDPGDQPFLNRRADGYVGRVFTLDKPIVDGFGTIRINDTVWRVSGPDCPAGSRVKVASANGADLMVEVA